MKKDNDIMVNQKRFNNKGELTPFLKNVIIVASLFIAVLIVLLIVYNVVNQSSETQKAEESADLNIVKSSVKIDEGILKLSVSGKLENLELKKVKFIISDITGEKNISLDAENFETQKSFEIDLKKLGIDYTKKITISIKPIIKKLTGERELKVTDKISLTPTGETKQEEIPVQREEKISTTITSCDKCGGLLGKGCDKLLCHSISEKCYYKGGLTRKCVSCSKMSCEQYKAQEDCSEDRCRLFKCTWDNGKCKTNPDCGDSYINSSLGETCEPPATACIPAYGIDCTYCGSGCNYVNLKGGFCSDSILNGNEQCDNGTANTNIPCTSVYGGSCSYCDTSCVTKSVAGASCGDGTCSVALGEDCSSCSSDCACSGGGCCLSGTCNAVGTCSGNSICSLGNWITYCGDGTCNCGETYSTCPADCSSTCGDGSCASGETYSTCPADCSSTCGDGSCASGETCSSCSADCGVCYTYSWYTGSWGTCSVACGGGTQTRTVYCKRNDGVQVADSYCTGTKPVTSQSCNTQECIWLLGEYHTEANCISIGGTVIASPHICRVSGECSSGWSYHENWGSWSATTCTGADITRTGNCGTKTLGGGTSCTTSSQAWSNSPAPGSCTYKKPSISVWAWGCGSSCTSGADCTDGDTACCQANVIYHSRYLGGCGNYNPGQCDYSMEYLILNDGTCSPTRLESGCK